MRIIVLVVAAVAALPVLGQGAPRMHLVLLASALFSVGAVYRNECRQAGTAPAT